MRNILKTIIVVSIFFLVILLTQTGLVQAQNNLQDMGTVLNEVGTPAGYDTTVDTPDPIIAVVIRVTLSLLGVIFLVIMIYGGFVWMTAMGNEERVTKAKNLIIAAIIGLLIIVGAYIITIFLFQEITTEALT